jgi:hypothetical protein
MDIIETLALVASTSLLVWGAWLAWRHRDSSGRPRQ